MADSSVMTNVPTTTEQSARGKRPKMVLFLSSINGLLILLSFGLTTEDLLVGLEADEVFEFDILSYVVLGGGLFFFYAIPLALLIGLYRGHPATWTAYRTIGWLGGIYFLIDIFGQLMFYLDAFPGIHPASFQSYLYCGFLLVVYLWLDTDSARKHFGMRPKHKRFALIQ